MIIKRKKEKKDVRSDTGDSEIIPDPEKNYIKDGMTNL